MNHSKLNSSRRRFLRSSGGVLISLPFFESLCHAVPATSSPPKRMIFLGMGFGVTNETWFPSKNEPGFDYKLPEGLQPLEKHRKDFTIVQNLQHKHTHDGHWGSTFWLTGANRYEVAGQSFHNTVSVDQVAADSFGRKTRFASLQLDGKGNGNEGHGPGLSLSWDRRGKPIAGIDTPTALFHRLFSQNSVPLEVSQRRLAKERSVLDAVLGDAKSLGQQLNPSDNDKLEEYFESIRTIEKQLSKEEEWLTIPKQLPSKSMKPPSESLRGVGEIRAMYDLMIAAMQVDATRVFSYRMPVSRMLSSLDISVPAHSMSHYNPGERMEASKIRDETHMKLLAEFITKLKATKEVDGSSLFDHVVVTFGSNIRSIHHVDNCPTLVTGAGAGIKHGRNLVLSDPNTPLCNFWLSLLRGVGVKVDSHGDSTGHIEELFSV